MPLYDYRCKECGHEFSDMQTISNMNVPVENPCPECNEQSIEKFLASAPILGYNKMPSNYKMSDNFRDRLKVMSENRGEGCTIKDAL